MDLIELLKKRERLREDYWANVDYFHYDLNCIDGENMQYTQYGLNEHYHWHQDEGIASLYKPQASGSRNQILRSGRRSYGNQLYFLR